MQPENQTPNTSHQAEMRKLLKRLHQSLPEIWKEQRRPSKQINMLHTSAVLLSLSIWIWLHGDGQGPAFWPAFSCVLAIGSTMYQL